MIVVVSGVVAIYPSFQASDNNCVSAGYDDDDGSASVSF